MNHTANDDVPWTKARPCFDEMWASGDSEMGRGFGEVPDMLATMMAMQRRHMGHYCNPQQQKPDSLQIPFDLELAGQWDKREVHESFRRTMGWAVEEIMEAVGKFKGKPWREHFEVPDYDGVLDELGDAMHFFLEACLVLGLTPEDLFKAYFGAAAKNVSRQKGDY